MTKPSPICPRCGPGPTLTKLGEPEAETLWLTWRCPRCRVQLTTRPLRGAERAGWPAAYFHVVKVWT